MKKLPNLSRFSSLLAVICAIHCAMMPLLLSLAPVLVSWMGHGHWLEWAMLGSAVVLGGIPLLRDFTHLHRSRLPLLLFLSGFVIMASPHLLHFHLGEYIFGFAGALLLIAAQVLNAQLRHKLRCDC